MWEKWEKKIQKWLGITWVRVATGFLMMNLLLTFSWSASYTIISYVSEKWGHSETLDLMRDEKSSVAALAASGMSPGEAQWKELSASKGYRIVVADAAGRRTIYGSLAGKASVPSDSDVQAVLGGDSIEKTSRPNLFKKGAATVGFPLTGDGGGQAVFLQRITPGLFNHYGKQTLLQVLAGVVMILIMLATRPWRRDLNGWIEITNALRRIAKGDFNVVINSGHNTPGQFGKLVSSINDMAVELNQMEQMRQTFISNVSHEIQSPLTSIRGFARALQEEGLDLQQRKHYYNIIETESVRLSKLSDNLLKLTSLESDKHPFELKRYRLDKQLRSMILACEPQWVAKNILMDVELTETTVEADEDLMSQVWMNILSNSVKFTGEGGTITVEAMPGEDGGAVVRISDNGTGIGEEDLPFIFERFFKADKSRNREKGGSGLGLSIVKRIVDMHGGEVLVSSTRGVGTTFTLRLKPPTGELTVAGNAAAEPSAGKRPEAGNAKIAADSNRPGNRPAGHQAVRKRLT